MHTLRAHQMRHLSFKGLGHALDKKPLHTSFMHALHLRHLHLFRPDALGNTAANTKSATFTICTKYIGAHHNLGIAKLAVMLARSTFWQAKVVKQDWVTMEFRFLQFRMHRYPLLHSNGQPPGVPRAQKRKTITISNSSNFPCYGSIAFWYNKIHGESPKHRCSSSTVCSVEMSRFSFHLFLYACSNVLAYEIHR